MAKKDKMEKVFDEVLALMQKYDLDNGQVVSIGVFLLSMELAHAIQHGALTSQEGVRLLMKNIIFQTDHILMNKDQAKMSHKVH